MNNSSVQLPNFWRRRGIPRIRNPGTAFSVCEILSYQDYGSGYQRLATLLGRPARQNTLDDVERLHDLLTRRHSPVGSLGLSDCLFLTAFVRIIAPKRMVEIGTGSGFSAALLALAIHSSRPEQRGVCVDTVDVNLEYFGDGNLYVGFEIEHLLADMPNAVRVHAPQQSNHIAALAEPEELELAFIDADHQHPRPLLDLLRIAPFVRSGGWILLHDIRLGSTRRETDCSYGACFGAEWLFEAWPFRKISGGNVGAVQLPEKKKELVAMAKKLLKLPFEVRDQRDRHLRSSVRNCFASLS